MYCIEQTSNIKVFLISDSIEVECKMKSDELITIIHNNLESDTRVQGYETPMSYQRNITYFATNDQIKAIKSSSTHCEQYLEFACTGALAFLSSFWTAFTGELISYRYPDDGNNTCICKLKEACILSGRRE